MNSNASVTLQQDLSHSPMGGWVCAGLRFSPSLLVGLLFTAGYLLVYHYDPVRYALSLGEDGVAEYATAMCFLTAALFLVGGSLMGKQAWTRRVVTLGIAAMIFAVGMEEISWGQRIFGLETPEALRKVNRQEELTLHNIWPGRIVNSIFLIVLTTWLTSSALIARRTAARAWAERHGWPMADLATAGVFIMVFVVMAWDPHFRFREASEWLLGIGVLAWAVLRVGRDVQGPKVDRRKLVVALVAAGLFASAATYAAVIKRPAWQGRMLNRIAERAYLEEGRYEQASTLLAFAMTRENYIVPTTYEAKLHALIGLGRQHEAGQLAQSQALPYYEKLIAQDPSEDNHRRLVFCRAVAVQNGQDRSASTDTNETPTTPPKTVEVDLGADRMKSSPLSIVGD